MAEERKAIMLWVEPELWGRYNRDVSKQLLKRKDMAYAMRQHLINLLDTVEGLTTHVKSITGLQSEQTCRK